MPGPGRARSIDKPQNMKLVFKRMLKDFKKEYVVLIFVILFAIGSAVLNIIAPIFLGEFLNHALPQDIATSPLFNFVLVDGSTVVQINWDYFFYNFGVLLGFYVGSALFSWLSEWLSVGVGARYAYEFRDKIQSIITQTTSGVSLFFGSLIAMFIYDYRLAFIALAVLPITLIIVLLISKHSQKQFASYRKELGDLNGKVEENYAGVSVIKLFNKEDDVEADFDIVNKRMAKADGLSQFLSGFVFPTTIFINNVAYVAIAVVGGIIGQIGTMISFFTLLSLFTRPFQQIGQIANIIQSVLASGERIYSLLDEVEEIPDKATAETEENKIQGEFDFDHVYFQYSIDKPLIEDFTLHVNKGDMVAIVGPTGAGKTTMVNLIMRFYEITNIANIDDLKVKSLKFRNSINQILGYDEIKDIDIDSSLDIREATRLEREKLEDFYQSAIKNNKKILGDDDIKKLGYIHSLIPNIFNNGNIKLDGKTIFNYTRNCLRGSIGMVLQDTWLFKGTIKENLLYGDPNATDEEIEKACKEAHIDHFIHTLPGGYNFVLNEDGSNVSQGQRQLLTIARAIISKPRIMILDEATSSVDTRTEQQIQDALNKIMENRTSFVIAHRLSTIKNAKLIIVMKKGHIVETGTHYELLKKGGFYAELYNSQFAGNNPMSKEAEES